MHPEVDPQPRDSLLETAVKADVTDPSCRCESGDASRSGTVARVDGYPLSRRSGVSEAAGLDPSCK
jgi:hypothetical protein